MTHLLQQRAAVPREDLEYVVEQAAKLKDTRLQQVIAELIGWGDDERAEIETYFAISIELMKKATPSRLRECVRTVELRHHMRKHRES